ncbi:MAG TPA: hypothetical protein VK874_17620 [Gaiellaceae bacterium]|nr:hypothetical protein [Gaiellaceae bacterium]
MHWNLKGKVVAGVVAVLALAGGGAALAATQLGTPKEESQAVVDDVAKQLGVQPSELSAAIEKALENRLDEAVAAGRLTQEQADRMKERLRAGDVPLFGHGLRGMHGPGHGLARGGHLEAAASYLGLSEAALREQLEAGKTLAEVAKARGKSVDGLVDTLVADAKKELDEAVAAGRLDEERRDDILERLEERLTAMVNGERPARGERGGFGRGLHRGGPWS